MPPELPNRLPLNVAPNPYPPGSTGFCRICGAEVRVLGTGRVARHQEARVKRNPSYAREVKPVEYRVAKCDAPPCDGNLYEPDPEPFPRAPGLARYSRLTEETRAIAMALESAPPARELVAA